MAATDRRRAVVLTLVVGLVVGLGACREGSTGRLPALPAPASDALRLEAVVHPAGAGGDELRVEATLHLDAATDEVVALPDRSSRGPLGEWAFLAHRAEGTGGGVVLAVGRGAVLDPGEPPPAGPRGADAPAPTPTEPRLVLPGTSVTGTGRTTPWPADDDAPDTVPLTDVAAADELRVCVWGAITTREEAWAAPPPSWAELICVDVPGPASTGR